MNANQVARAVRFMAQVIAEGVDGDLQDENVQAAITTRVLQKQESILQSYQGFATDDSKAKEIVARSRQLKREEGRPPIDAKMESERKRRRAADAKVKKFSLEKREAIRERYIHASAGAVTSRQMAREQKIADEIIEEELEMIPNEDRPRKTVAMMADAREDAFRTESAVEEELRQDPFPDAQRIEQLLSGEALREEGTEAVVPPQADCRPSAQATLDDKPPSPAPQPEIKPPSAAKLRRERKKQEKLDIAAAKRRGEAIASALARGLQGKLSRHEVQELERQYGTDCLSALHEIHVARLSPGL
jgi:hypothetical protein